MTWHSTKLLGALKYQIYIGEGIWNIFHQSATYCSHMEANPMSLCILCHMVSICPHPHWLKERANSTLDVFQRGRDFSVPADSDGCSERRDHLNHLFRFMFDVYTCEKQTIQFFGMRTWTKYLQFTSNTFSIGWERRNMVGYGQEFQSPFMVFNERPAICPTSLDPKRGWLSSGEVYLLLDKATLTEIWKCHSSYDIAHDR